MKCVTCGEEKSETEFNWRWKALGIRQKSCRECQHKQQGKYYQTHQEEEKERTRRRRVSAREDARDFVYSYKLTHPCVDCGNTDPEVLDFDHVRGKSKTINHLIRDGASIDRIQIELNLCEVRCANCHRKKTARERREIQRG